MLKRSHVLLVSCLIAVASNSFLCGVGGGGKGFIKRLKEQYMKENKRHKDDSDQKETAQPLQDKSNQEGETSVKNEPTQKEEAPVKNEPTQEGETSVIAPVPTDQAEEKKQDPIKITELQRIKVAAGVVALSPSGKRLVVSLKNDENTIMLYKKNTEGKYEEKDSYSIEGFEPYRIELSPDDNSKQLACWVQKGKDEFRAYFLIPHVFKIVHYNQVEDGAYSPNGSQLASIQHDQTIMGQNISVWNTQNNQLLRRIPLEKMGVNPSIKLDTIQYHRAGNMLMTLGHKKENYDDKVVYAIDIVDMESYSKQFFGAEFVNALITSNGNVILKSTNSNKGETLIQLASACNLLLKNNIIIPEKPGLLEALDDSGSGSLYYLYKNNDKERKTNVWQLDRKECTAEKVGSVPWSNLLALSQDGSTLVRKNQGELTVYKVEKRGDA